jgi:DNA-binding transcriptional regulator YiaG
MLPMAKDLPPVVQFLKKWRAANKLSQADASAFFRHSGLPVPLRTLQNWECGRFPPNPYAATALNDFLLKHPKVSVKRDPSKPGPKPFLS